MDIVLGDYLIRDQLRIPRARTAKLQGRRKGEVEFEKRENNQVRYDRQNKIDCFYYMLVELFHIPRICHQLAWLEI